MYFCFHPGNEHQSVGWKVVRFLLCCLLYYANMTTAGPSNTFFDLSNYDGIPANVTTRPSIQNRSAVIDTDLQKGETDIQGKVPAFCLRTKTNETKDSTTKDTVLQHVTCSSSQWVSGMCVCLVPQQHPCSANTLLFAPVKLRSHQKRSDFSRRPKRVSLLARPFTVFSPWASRRCARGGAYLRVSSL